MATRCEVCGRPARATRPGRLLCAGCRERDEQADKRYADAAGSGRPWNTSRDDPWWREWLTSGELFAALQEIAAGSGERVGALLGGLLYEVGRGSDPWVHVWVAPDGVVVAYATVEERCGIRSEGEGPHELEGWAHHVRHSEPLELGQVRGRSSYGALRPGGPASRPVVKWAQAGDWAGLARWWHPGLRRSDD